MAAGAYAGMGRLSGSRMGRSRMDRSRMDRSKMVRICIGAAKGGTINVDGD